MGHGNNVLIQVSSGKNNYQQKLGLSLGGDY